MRSRRFLSLISIILIIATLLVSCGGDPESTGGGKKNNAVQKCEHTKTTLKNLAEGSCSKKGYTGDEVCTACGAVVKLGSSTDYVHKWDKGETTKQPTCMEVGTLTYTCTLCATTKLEAIPTVPHEDIYHDVYDGTHNHTCTMCVLSEYEKHTPVDPKGKKFPATCTEPAYTRYECSLCNKYYKVYSDAKSDKETGHTWLSWEQTTYATCVREGKKTHSCNVCGEGESVIIPIALEKHDFVEVGRENSTCTVAGHVDYECKDCPKTDSRPLPLAAHELQSSTGSDGWTHSNCKNCTYTVSSFNASNVKSATLSSSNLNTERAFEIKTKDAILEFPKEVVEQMTNGSSSVDIDAGVLEDDDKQSALNLATNLTPEQKGRLESVDIFNFGVSTVSGNFETKVTVKIPYTLKDGEEADGIVIWFVGTNGDIQSIEATYADGFVTFEAQHFSYYAVAYEETQEMKCRRGNHDYRSTGKKVNPTCSEYGYTVYECSCCHDVEVKDIVNKLDHKYGELTEPTVTCDMGGYWHKTCSKCGDVKNFTYVRAKGHTVTKRATCTENSVCSDCKEVAEFAHGHKFGEWKTVIEASDIREGIRRRNCSTCGTVEEVRIAPTGNIEQYNFSSYQDMMEFVLSDILFFENGTVTFESEIDDMTVSMDITIEKIEGSYLMLMEVYEAAYRYNHDTGKDELKEYKFTYAYRDGVMALVDVTDGYGDITDIDYRINDLPFEIFMDYMEQTFDRYAPSIEGSFDEIAEVLDIFDAFAGAEINERLEANDIDMRVGDLSELFNQLRLLYAYNAQKLGFKTGIALDGTVPTAKDMLKVLENCTTVSQGNNGQTVYSFDLNDVFDALEIVMDWAEENENNKLSQVVYDLISEDIKEIYPGVTNWESFIKELKKNFTPNMKFGKAIDKIVSILETKKIVSVNGFYSLIESLCFDLTGQTIDIEDYIKTQTNDATLGEFVKLAFGYDSLDRLWREIDSYFTETYFGDIIVLTESYYDYETDEYYVESYSLSAFIDELRKELDRLTYEYQLEFVVDELGHIVSLDISTNYENEKYTSENISYTLSVKADDSVKVTLPNGVEKMLGTKITKTFNKDGDLVVTVPSGYNYEFGISGYGYISLDEAVVRDAELSAKFGYDIYVLKKEYWSNSRQFDEYIEVGGKYYEFEYEYISGSYTAGDRVALVDIQKDWRAILPASGAKPDGYLENDSSVAVYNTVLNRPVFKLDDGEWYMATDYSGNYGGKYYVYDYDLVSKVVNNIQISNRTEEMDSTTIVDQNGNSISVLKLYLSLDGFDETIRVYAIIDDQSKIVLLETVYNAGEEYCRIIKEVKELPIYDDLYRYSTYYKIIDSDGKEVQGTAYTVELYENYPSYYAKIDDGQYIRMDESYNNNEVIAPSGIKSSIKTQGKETIKLPSGKTMYIVSKQDSVVYGYTKISANLYVQTACRYNGSKIEKVVYRDAEDEVLVSYGRAVDINKYIVKSGNTYTIDAEAIQKLKDLCVTEGSNFMIRVKTETTIGGIQCDVEYMAYSYMVKDEDIFSYSDYHEEYYGWYEVFGEDSKYGFTVIPNSDGSITVMTNGETATVNYDYQNFEITDSMVTLDTQKTAQYGQNVYSLPSFSEDFYVHKDGKYYEYSSEGVYRYELVTTDIKNIVSNYWSIDSLYYGYVANVDGNYVPVYLGGVLFLGSYGIVMYFAVYDGKLCVLAGAEELSDSVIKFEELIPVNEYFDTIARYATLEEYSSGSFLNEDLQSVTYIVGYVTIDCQDALYGDSYSFRVQYVESGTQKKFITERYSAGSLLELGDEVNLDNAYRIKKYGSESYLNGTFEIVGAYVKEDVSVVKILGEYYYLDHESWWASYLDNRIDEDEFESYFKDEHYYYAVYEGDTVKFYSECYFYDDGTIELGGRLSDDMSEIDYADYWCIGQTEDGYDVYSYTYYAMPDDVVEEVQPDGTVLVYREGYSWGYLRCKDGYYIYVDLVDDGDETYIELDIEKAYVSSSNIIDSYIVTTDDISFTISKDIINVIPDTFEIIFEINYNYDFILDYEDLKGWFEIAKKQNASSKYYEYNYSTDEFEPV